MAAEARPSKSGVPVEPIHVGASALKAFFEMGMCHRYIALKGKFSVNAIWCDKDGKLLPLTERLLLEWGVPPKEIGCDGAFRPELVVLSKDKKVWCRGFEKEEMFDRTKAGDNRVLRMADPKDLNHVRMFVMDDHTGEKVDESSIPFVDRGYDWEEALLARLRENQVPLRCKVDEKGKPVVDKKGNPVLEPLRCKVIVHEEKDENGKTKLDRNGKPVFGVLTRDETLESLKDETWIKSYDALVLYQPELFAPENMYEDLGITERPTIQFHRNYPDFIIIYPPGGARSPEKRRVVVVDAKAREYISSGHKIQVAFYVYMLRKMLKFYKLEDKLHLDDLSGIWLRDMSDYTPFNSALILPVIESILSTGEEFNAPISIAEAAYSQIEDLPIRGSSCRYCQFNQFCKRLLSSIYPEKTKTEETPVAETGCIISHETSGSFDNWEDRDVDSLDSRNSEEDKKSETTTPSEEESSESDEEQLCDEKHAEGAPPSLSTIFGIGRNDIKLINMHLQEKGKKRLANIFETLEFLDECCSSAEKEGAYLSSEKDCAQCIRAVVKKEVYTKEHGVLQFSPRGETICVYFTLGFDSFTSTLFGYDIAVAFQNKKPQHKLDELRKKIEIMGVSQEELIHITSPSSPTDICENLVKSLYSVLNEVNQVNCPLRIFTYHGSEYQILFSILLRIASGTGALKKEAVSLLSTLFTKEGGIIYADVVPQFEKVDCGKFLCVLDQELCRNFGLPLRNWEFKLENCAKAFGVDVPSGIPIGYHDLGDFVVQKKTAKEPISWDTISKSLKISSSVLHRLLTKIREKLKDFSSIPPKTFKWVPYIDDSLSAARKMAVLPLVFKAEHYVKELLEIYLDCVSIETHLKRRNFYKVKYVGLNEERNKKFSVVGATVEKSSCRFRQWLLIPCQKNYSEVLKTLIEQVNVTNICCPSFFNKYIGRYVYVPPEGWFVVSCDDNPKEGDTTFIGKVYSHKLKGDYILVPWKSEDSEKKAYDYALKSVGDQSSTFEDLFGDSMDSKARRWRDVPFCKASQVIMDEALKIIREDPAILEFSANQREVIEKIASSHVTLLWGPPHTGTTSLLEKLMILLTLAQVRAGGREKLRILYTSSEHDTRQHFLDQVKELRDKMKIPTSAVSIGMMNGREMKIKTVDGNDRSAKEFFSNPVVVVAGSIHQMRKEEFHPDRPYDIVILDDSHKSKIQELFVLFEFLDRERSRIIVAGDPVQTRDDHSFRFIPSIRPVGDFVKPEDVLKFSQAPAVTKPPFDCLLSKLDRQDDFSALSENWHLSDELCRLLYDWLYGPNSFLALNDSWHKNKEFCDAVNNGCGHPKSFPRVLRSLVRPFDVAIPSESPDVSRCVFAPGKSLAVVLFPWDKKPTFSDEHFEDEIVLDLYNSLRHCLEMKDLSENDFWSEKFMIGCVRHAQRDSIKAKLESLIKLPPNSPILSVETLDKISEWKRDVCLIDFTSFNSDHTGSDSNKFFNPGVLSIMLSRGKRCIVLTSLHVLAGYSPSDIVSLERWALGLNVLHNLVKYADENHSLFRVPLPPPPSPASK